MNVLNMGGSIIGAIHMDMNVMEEAILSIMVIVSEEVECLFRRKLM